MRAVVWDMPWDDEYDDLSSFEPGGHRTRRVPAEPPLPPSATWDSGDDATPEGTRQAGRPIASGIILFLVMSACVAWLLVALQPALLAEGLAARLWIVAVLVGYGLATMAISRKVLGVPRPLNTIRRLAEGLGSVEVYPVRVHIIQGRVVTGSDVGISWFHKDAIHFRGLETSFVLGAQNLRFDPMALGVGHGALQHGWVTPTLTLRHPERNVAVRFMPFGKFDKSDRSDRGYRFRHNLRLFLSHWRESHVPSLYPPLEPRPSWTARGLRAVVQVPERERIA